MAQNRSGETRKAHTRSQHSKRPAKSVALAGSRAYSFAHDTDHAATRLAWPPSRAALSLGCMHVTALLTVLPLSFNDAGTDPDDTYHVDISISEGNQCDEYDLSLACAELEAEQEEQGLHWDSAYFTMGVAPAIALHQTGFHPHLRYDVELGMVWEHRRSSVAVGVDGHISHFFHRKSPGGGADVVLTGAYGPVYLRGGVGVLTGIPRSADLYDFRPAAGGVVGIGLQGGKEDFIGRVGVDYDVRFDDSFGVTHTVMVVAKFAWGI